ncbi:hypothetical protein FJV83_31505 [Mesorhizobium sp. WSM4307]|uniref:hypothetical protein n=1 Tax=unclassified Mesorhizobium TaxID=325217 RepID=UPI00115E863A|nr:MULTISPECIES: hypothetical protein [unclassified Mesorhizobium]TRC72051.1 hypothetical protein FJV81_30465 [Mesorhizobium sp. WSM4315]TRC77827.1 hypothetical protein FJV83_31505 [Mesorhizobium sp. WSM4307]
MVSLPFERSGEWHFCTAFDEQRRVALEGSPGFPDIADAICRNILPTAKPSKEPANDERLKDCWRIKFVFSVPPVTFDRFFNGPCGIRAQFLNDAELGRCANSHMVMMLRPKVLRALESEHTLRTDGPGQWSASGSIDGLSSKVWINELSVHCNSRDLAIARREAAAGQNGTDSRGLCAPTGTELVLFGAWINPDGVEMVLPEKIKRHDEIHLRGYS